MIFTSLIFLYLFLPVTLLSFLFITPKLKKPLLLIASLIFYAWGGVSFCSILMGSILMNYLAGMLIEKSTNRFRKFWYIAGILLNIAGLVIFRYTTFLVSNIDTLLALLKINPIPVKNVFLPLGISFFTFKGICYLITVYRKETPAQRNIINLGLYIGFFPTLIAGPIDRYRSIEPQFSLSGFNPELFASGVRRFGLGLAKKVIIAAPIGYVADHIFSSPVSALNSPLAWLGAVSYMLQIYYDFSGYTDMAIGLGRMFGFQFAENFNFPYTSHSIREFWTRWHITLSTWLRDYLFLPLAYSTSRKLKKENYSGIRVDNLIYGIAILITFFICGFWHGSSWTFVSWGVFYGLLLLFERTRIGKKLNKAPAVFRHVYTLFFVLIAWVIFRSPNMAFAYKFIKVMFGMGMAKTEWTNFTGYLGREYLTMMIFAILGCTPVFGILLRKIKSGMNSEGILSGLTFHIYQIVSFVFLFLVMAYSTMVILTNTLQSFIYFRF